MTEDVVMVAGVVVLSIFTELCRAMVLALEINKLVDTIASIGTLLVDVTTIEAFVVDEIAKKPAAKLVVEAIEELDVLPIVLLANAKVFEELVLVVVRPAAAIGTPTKAVAVVIETALATDCSLDTLANDGNGTSRVVDDRFSSVLPIDLGVELTIVAEVRLVRAVAIMRKVNVANGTAVALIVSS